MKKFMNEFKEFAMRGSVLDMAIGVVIGGAFGKIIASLVGDIITPLISLITGSANFENLQWIIKPAMGEIPAVTLNYGSFLQAILDFIIIAFFIFLMIRGINRLKHEKPEEVVEEEKSEEVVLLENILNELKKGNK